MRLYDIETEAHTRSIACVCRKASYKKKRVHRSGHCELLVTNCEQNISESRNKVASSEAKPLFGVKSGLWCLTARSNMGLLHDVNIPGCVYWVSTARESRARWKISRFGSVRHTNIQPRFVSGGWILSPVDCVAPARSPSRKDLDVEVV